MFNKRYISALKVLTIALPLLFLTGCAESLFHWGKYEDSLVERYIENDTTQTETHLRETFTEAETTQKHIPPGIYADYGFMLYKRGDKSSAISYFQKEKALYPEASFFMNKLIERIKLQSNTAAVGDKK
jgi:hypothetical protein